MQNEIQSNKVSVREAVFDLLRQLGINTIFGNPGSTELPMFRDFPKDFRYVLALQESVAVSMADGFAQASHTAGVVNLHSASGVGHGLGSVFTAFRNRTPMVIIAGQQSRSILPFDPYLYAQDAAQFPKPYVKFSMEPARPEDVPLAIARAYYMAMQPPCGPVFVSVPVDDWDCMTEPLVARSVASIARPESGAIDLLTQALGASNAPAFVIGAEVDRDGGWDAAVKLAERYGATVFSAPNTSRIGFPETHALFAGTLPPIREKIVSMLDGHDLILAIGTPVFPYHIEGRGIFVPENAEVIQITEDPVAASSAAVGRSIVGSTRLAMQDLLDRSGKVDRVGPAVKRPRPGEVQADGAISNGLVMQALAKLRPANSVIVHEAPSASAMRQAYLPITSAESFYVTASGGLGFALPAAVGIALARPDRKVIATLGDGSAMYTIQGLWTASQFNLPITFIIFKNRRYEALRTFASVFKLPANVLGSDLEGLSFKALAVGHGCDAHEVERAEDLEPVLREALRATRPTLIEIEIA